MSPRFPWVSAAQVIAVLRKRGFLLVRSSGSHHIFRNAKGARVTVAVHAGKIIHPKVLDRILRDAKMTGDDFLEALG